MLSTRFHGFGNAGPVRSGDEVPGNRDPEPTTTRPGQPRMAERKPGLQEVGAPPTDDSG